MSGETVWVIPKWKTKNGWVQHEKSVPIGGNAVISILAKRIIAKTAVFGITVKRDQGSGTHTFDFEYNIRSAHGKKTVTLKDDVISDTIYCGLLLKDVDEKFLDTDGSLTVTFNLRFKQPPKTSMSPQSMQALTSSLPVKQTAPSLTKTELTSLTSSLTKPEVSTAVEFVGLENQGATCYMNSALQSLFHLSKFRQIVYKIPTQDIRDSKSSVALNLQALFCNLQTAKDPCSTLALTQSFGWDNDEAFVQHDIQEFMHLLIDAIEKKTEKKGEISELFRGKLLQRIECRGFQRDTPQDFDDLSLQVRDCASVIESLRKYVAKDVIEGYDTEDRKLGKQTVSVSLQFDKLPPLLQLHLKRYEFDLKTLAPVKIDSRFSFPLELDMSEFLNEKSKGKHPTYRLYGVFVHSGHAGGGHYYVYLRPMCGQKWYRFDDSNVQVVDERTAVENNFGGLDKEYSAYMLMYVRNDSVQQLFPLCDHKLIPRHVLAYATEQRAAAPRGSTTPRYSVTVITSKALRVNTMRGIYGMACPDLDLTVKVPADMTTFDFYGFLASQQGANVERLRIWKLTSSYELGSVVLPADEIVCQLRPSIFFAEVDEEMDDVFVGDSDVVLFLKVFTKNPKLPIFFFGTVTYDQKDPVSVIEEDVRKPLGLSATTSIDFYLETSETLLPLDKKRSFLTNRVVLGSTIVLQPGVSVSDSVVAKYTLTKQELSEASRTVSYYDHFRAPLTSPSDFMHALKDVRTVPLYHYDSHKEIITTIRIPKRAKAEDLRDFLVRAFNLEIAKGSELVLFGDDGYTRRPARKPFDILPTDIGAIYYWIGKPLALGETVQVYWSLTGYKTSGTRFCYLPPDITVQEAISFVRDVSLPEHVRVMTFKDSVFEKVYTDKKEKMPVHGSSILISAVPADQVSTPISELTQVVHVYVEKSGNFEPFSVPFFLKIAPKETTDAVRIRIQEKFEMGQEQAAHLRLQKSDTTNSKFDQKLVLSRDSIVHDSPGKYLLLIHTKRNVIERTISPTLKIHD